MVQITLHSTIHSTILSVRYYVDFICINSVTVTHSLHGTIECFIAVHRGSGLFGVVDFQEHSACIVYSLYILIYTNQHCELSDCLHINFTSSTKPSF